MDYVNRIQTCRPNLKSVQNHSYNNQGRHFSFFPGGGNILIDVLGGGAKYEKNIILCAKTQKGTIFKIPGGGANHPALPPNDVPDNNF